MSRVWVVVAHRAGARFLELDSRTKVLSLVEDIPHPDGRKKSSELDTDRPGQAFARAGQGGGHPMPTAESAHDRTAADFGRDLSDRLRKHRNDNRFEELVLVAEPRFLGMLQGSLDSVTAGTVKATVNKDLAHVEVSDLGPHLAPALTVRAENRRRT